MKLPFTSRPFVSYLNFSWWMREFSYKRLTVLIKFFVFEDFLTDQIRSQKQNQKNATWILDYMLFLWVFHAMYINRPVIVFIIFFFIELYLQEIILPKKPCNLSIWKITYVRSNLLLLMKFLSLTSVWRLSHFYNVLHNLNYSIRCWYVHINHVGSLYL